MRDRMHALLGSLTAVLLLAPVLMASVHGQAAVTRDDIVSQLNHFETAPTLDLPALRTQTQERSRIRSRTEPPPQKRTPIAPDLLTLATVNLDITFDVDTPIVRPDSYQAVGRLADALVTAPLLPYTFLIVGHIEANGKREANVTLSQRRADAIRDILVNTFKISAKRLQSIGLGEEQLLDPAHPTGPANQQIQIMTIAKTPDEERAAPAAPTAPAAASAAKKRHR